MKMTRIIILVFAFNCTQLFAQEDTIPKQVIYSWTLNQYSLNTIPENIDTSLESFQNYNLLLKNRYTLNYLGNLGSPAQQHSYFKRWEDRTDFVFSEPYAIYFHHPEKQKYYNTKRQYTELSYSNAGKKNESEQTLGVLHTQNVNEKLNVGIDYDMISSEGRYQSQQIRQNDVTLFSSYTGERYNFYGNFSLNRLKAQENGGIDSLKYLGDDDYKNRRNIPVRLEDVTSEVYSTNLQLINEIKLGKKVTEYTVEKKVERRARRSSLNSQLGKKDNTVDVNNNQDAPVENNDSVYYDTTYTSYVKLSGFSFSHEFTYNRQARKFYDEDIDTIEEPFYIGKSFFLDSSMTSDQVYQNLLGNKLSIHYNKGDLVCVSLGIYNQQMSYDYSKPFIDVTVAGVDTLVEKDVFDEVSSTSISGYLRLKHKRFKFSTYTEYFFEGYKTGNTKLGFMANYNVFKSHYIGMSGKYDFQKPDYFYKNYSSNHFNWSNDNLNEEQSWNIKALYSNKKSKTNIIFNYKQLNNYLYFDSIALVNQHDESIDILSVEFNQNFKLGPFHSSTNLVYQSSSNDSIISLPNYLVYQTLYYQRLFKFPSTGGRLLMQFGVDYRYTSEYYADDYMPLSGVFYKQNKYKMEHYHRFDVFLNFNIKRANLFLRYDYINSAINNTYYYNAPYYPSPQPVFKFGVLWTFYN